MTFLHTWILIISNVAVIIGVHILFREHMFLGKWGNWVRDTLGGFWSKPLTECPPCMSSVHGIWFYSLFGGPWLFLPVYLLMLCGTTYAIFSKIEQ